MSNDNNFEDNNAGTGKKTNFGERRTKLNNLVSGLGKLPPQALEFFHLR